MGIVVRGFQAGARPGPGPKRKTTVALNASDLVVRWSASMHAVRPGARPGGVGQSTRTGTATSKPTNRRRPSLRRGRTEAAEPGLAPEVEEPAGAGAGVGGATHARYHGHAFRQALRAAEPIDRVSGALTVTVVVPGEGLATA